MIVPEDWRYTPGERPRACPHCGHKPPGRCGMLYAPDGRHWALVGNASTAQEQQMVKAIVEANT